MSTPPLLIQRIDLYHGHMPVEMALSYGRASTMPFCIAQITTTDNLIGTGEGLHVDPASAAITARTLLSRDAALCDQLLPPVPFTWQTSVIREMFSIALHDLAARAPHHPRPLWAHLGGTPQPHSQLMPCIFPTSPQHAFDTASKFISQGFTALKIKFFGDLATDLASLSALRRAAPNAFLQADANAGYKSLTQAKDALPRFADAGLTAIEDPLAGPVELNLDLMSLPNRPKIILDMPTRGTDALLHVCLLRCCDAVNLHPNMQGTLTETLARASLCAAHGIPIQIGGTGYTGIGTWASLHLAAILHSPFPMGEVGGWRDHATPASTCANPPDFRTGTTTLSPSPGHSGLLNLPWLAQHAKHTVIQAH
jgi:L-alanine-DL-glutamate epimerase-like enolase superfamily enzyme